MLFLHHRFFIPISTLESYEKGLVLGGYLFYRLCVGGIVLNNKLKVFLIVFFQMS